MDENKVSGEELLEKAERIEQLRKRKIELERMTTGERLKLAAEQGMKKKCEKEIQSAKNAGSDTTKKKCSFRCFAKEKGSSGAGAFISGNRGENCCLGKGIQRTSFGITAGHRGDFSARTAAGLQY